MTENDIRKLEVLTSKKLKAVNIYTVGNIYVFNSDLDHYLYLDVEEKNFYEIEIYYTYYNVLYDLYCFTELNNITYVLKTDGTVLLSTKDNVIVMDRDRVLIFTATDEKIDDFFEVGKGKIYNLDTKTFERNEYYLLRDYPTQFYGENINYCFLWVVINKGTIYEDKVVINKRGNVIFRGCEDFCSLIERNTKENLGILVKKGDVEYHIDNEGNIKTENETYDFLEKTYYYRF